MFEFSCIFLWWSSAAPGGAEVLHAGGSEEAGTEGAALPAEVYSQCVRPESAGRSLLPHLFCDPYQCQWGESVNLLDQSVSFNISFPGPGSVSFRQTTTGWSVWLLSTSRPSPSPLSICSCRTYSVRSHRLRTTPSPCRSMLRCWGKIHG